MWLNFIEKAERKKTQQHTVAARPLLQVRKKLLFAKKTSQHKILFIYTVQKRNIATNETKRNETRKKNH